MLFKVSKEDKNKGGVYEIKNSINGIKYIGRTFNFRIRYISHRRQLNINAHKNIRLQRLVNKYGIEKLTFELIEIVPRPDGIINIYDDLLNKREQFWFDIFDFKKLYNVLRYAGSYVLQKKSSEEREEISLRLRGSNAPSAKLSEIDIEKIYECFINKKNDHEIALLFNVSPATIGDIRHKRTWRHLTNEIDKRYGHDPSFYIHGRYFKSKGSKNRIITDEFRKKHTGINNGRALLKEKDVQFILKNKNIIPVKKLAAMFKVNKMTISHIHQRLIWKHIQINF